MSHGMCVEVWFFLAIGVGAGALIGFVGGYLAGSDATVRLRQNSLERLRKVSADEDRLWRDRRKIEQALDEAERAGGDAPHRAIDPATRIRVLMGLR